VINLSQLLTVNKAQLDEAAGRLPGYLMSEVGEGPRLMLGV
jgi:hypothetical protein